MCLLFDSSGIQLSIQDANREDEEEIQNESIILYVFHCVSVCTEVVSIQNIVHFGCTRVYVCMGVLESLSL